MTKYLFAFLYFLLASPAFALPTDALLGKVNAVVVRVYVVLEDGRFGLGSGVIVDKEQVATDCHVIANAHSISVVSWGDTYAATAIKADWHHDVCIIKVAGLNLPFVTIGSSKNLKYQQPVYATGFPDFSQVARTSFGYVKGLYPMDDTVMVRASCTFRMGDSGGGLFDNDGNLVGLITVKSPGRNAYYFYTPVEWLQTLLKQPEQAINSKSELPFWAEAPEKWPFFMRVTQPFLNEDWPALFKVATQWIEQDPLNAEAWFYLAAAEYGTKDTVVAENHFSKALALNSQHSLAIYYLGLIAEANGNHTGALTNVALLNQLDVDDANQLRQAIGMSPEER